MITHLPSNAVLAEVGNGGYTGHLFLAAGDSLVVTEKVMKAKLAEVTRK